MPDSFTDNMRKIANLLNTRLADSQARTQAILNDAGEAFLRADVEDALALVHDAQLERAKEGAILQQIEFLHDAIQRFNFARPKPATRNPTKFDYSRGLDD